MPRRGKRCPAEAAQPDFRYDDLLVTQFVSSLLKAGKRSTAEQIFYSAVDQRPELSPHRLDPRDQPVLVVRSDSS